MRSTRRPFDCSRLVLVAACLAACLAAAEPEKISIRLSQGRVELRLENEPIPVLAGSKHRHTLQESSDLRNWTTADGAVTDGDPLALLIAQPASNARFFRLQSEVLDSEDASDGADMFGYNRIFREELRRADFLTPRQFAAEPRHSPGYLARIDFDPREAKYWDLFNADPQAFNAGLPADSADKRSFDFRLNRAELNLFLTNGFVVSQRLGSWSFADVFYRIFNDDLPVFISADAILHAWHYSYQRMLSEMEETQLAPALDAILNRMRTALSSLPESVRVGILRQSVEDADLFLTVALSLSDGLPKPSLFGQAEQAGQILAYVRDATQIADLQLFGTVRTMDFSQFQLRGHYSRSENLANYFRTSMWLARADLPVLAAQPSENSLRSLGTAIVLTHLLRASGELNRWQELDKLIRLMVGRPDSMTVPQLQALLDLAGLTDLDSIQSTDTLDGVHRRIVQGDLGAQFFASDVHYSPLGTNQAQLPRTFAFLGQRFNPDAWALAQVTSDRILWSEDIPGVTQGKKVLRRFPTALDVVYAILGNRQIGLELSQMMLATNPGRNFRDGLPYAHNLTALAATVDRIAPEAWEDSIAMHWLGALRALSPATTHPRFPQAMRTRAWAMRVVNTQLASFTELKHDTLLYAKQPYASSFLCDYPAGFVEPLPEFWRRLRRLAETTAEGLSRVPVAGTASVTTKEDPVGQRLVDLALRQAARVAHCRNFAAQMAILERLATKELEQQPFTDQETLFIRGLMNRQDRFYLGPTFDGWYPGLFYKDHTTDLATADENGSNKQADLVADVFTAPPDMVDPQGGVLHVATGRPDLLMIAVDNGLDRMVYAGPVTSHYEFIVPGPNLIRMTDPQWASRTPPPSSPPIEWPPRRPVWTRGYLVETR